MQQKKILIFLTSAYPNDNGEVFVENEIPYLEKAFDKIIIICSSKSNESLNRYIPKNAKVIYYNDSFTFFNKLISLKYVFSPLFWNEIVHIRKKLKLKLNIGILKILFIELLKTKKLALFLKDYIHQKNNIYLYSCWTDYKAVAISLIKEKFPQTKAFSRAHGWDVYLERHLIKYLPLRNYIFENLDTVFFISENGNHYTASKYPEYSDKFITAKLGTTIPGKPEFKMNNGFLNIVSCSYIIPLKNIPLIVDSLSLINDIKIHWIHFGDGYEKQNIEKYANEKLTAKKNITYIFPGFIHNAEVISYYKQNIVDLFINTSSSEGIPVSIMEAMSSGIPVIATSVGGIPEIVRDNYNGFLLTVTPTAQEVADKIIYFYNLQEEEKLRLRKNAYKIWDEEYNAEKNYANFVNQILKL